MLFGSTGQWLVVLLRSFGSKTSLFGDTIFINYCNWEDKIILGVEITKYQDKNISYFKLCIYINVLKIDSI